MKTQNLSYDEILKILNNYQNQKEEFLKNVLKYESDTGILREHLYFNLFDDCVSWGTTPLFESKEEVSRYLKH